MLQLQSITNKGEVMKKYNITYKEELLELISYDNVYLGDIDTSAITDMSKLFKDSKREDFSGIDSWDVSNVRDIRSMFKGCENFNHSLEN